MKEKNLTSKQRLFCDEYLIDLNATQAAIRAGYSVNRASEIGHQLLQKTTVSEYIDKRIKNRESRTEITQDKVLNELSKIAFANGTDFAKVIEKSYMKPIYDSEDNKIGEEEIIYKDVEIIPTDELPDDKKKAIASIKQTKFGIAVEPSDKLKALELLGRHLGMFTDKIQAQIANDNTNTNINITAQEIMNLPEEEREKYIDDLAKMAKGE